MIEVDTNQWPLVRFRAHGVLSLDVFHEYLGHLDEFLGRNQRFGVLFASEGIKSPDVRVVKIHAEWFKENHAACAERWIGSALVFDNALPRFLTSTMMRLVRLPMPIAVHDSHDAAARWLAERFTACGMPLPPALCPGS